MTLQGHRKYSALIFFFILGALAFFVIRPFFIAILSAAVIAILINPIYKQCQKYLKSKALSAFATTTIAILIILIPLTAIINRLVVEISQLYQKLSSAVSSDEWNIEGFITFIETTTGTQIQLQTYLNQTFSALMTLSQQFLVSLPGRVLSLFIMIFLLYYFLKEQEKIMAYIKESLPFDEKHNNLLLRRAKQVTRGIIFGTLLVAILQGVTGWLGYYVLGLPSPIFLAILTAIFALVPLIGAWIVYVPASLYLFFIHLDDGMWWKGFAMLAYGVLIISSIDNLLRPKLVGQTAHVHPTLILLGVFGGLALFGIPGFILGPLILALFFEFIHVYKEQL